MVVMRLGYNSNDPHKYLYIVLIGDFSIDNPPQTHFYSEKNAHEYARKLARSRRGGAYSVIVYKVNQHHYDLDLGCDPRRRYGIIKEWYYPSGGQRQGPSRHSAKRSPSKKGHAKRSPIGRVKKSRQRKRK